MQYIFKKLTISYIYDAKILLRVTTCFGQTHRKYLHVFAIDDSITHGLQGLESLDSNVLLKSNALKEFKKIVLNIHSWSQVIYCM